MLVKRACVSSSLRFRVDEGADRTSSPCSGVFSHSQYLSWPVRGRYLVSAFYVIFLVLHLLVRPVSLWTRGSCGGILIPPAFRMLPMLITPASVDCETSPSLLPLQDGMLLGRRTTTARPPADVFLCCTPLHSSLEIRMETLFRPCCLLCV